LDIDDSSSSSADPFADLMQDLCQMIQPQSLLMNGKLPL